MGMVGEACLPSNAYYPRTPDYTLCSGVHVCWSEHSDSSFVYGFMSLDYGFGTMTGTTYCHKVNERRDKYIMIIIIIKKHVYPKYSDTLPYLPNFFNKAILPASVAHLDARSTCDQVVADSTPAGSATFFCGDWSWFFFYGHSLPSVDSRKTVVSFWRKNMHNTG